MRGTVHPPGGESETTTMSNRKAHSGSRLLTCLLAALTFLAWAPAPGAAAPSATGQSRVEAFLADLQKASTGAEVAALLEKANLSEAELKLVAQELGKPSWVGKLDAFKRTAPRSAAHPPTLRKFEGKRAPQVVSDVRLSLEQAHATKLAAGAQSLQRRLGAVRAAGAALPARPPSVPQLAGGGLIRGRSPYAGDPATAPRIDSVDPSVAVVGQTVAIAGLRFGNTAGRVVVLAGDELFPCDLLSWRGDRITVRIPREARPWSTMGEVPPDVHDEPRGGQSGGSGSSFGVNRNRFRPAANLRAELWVKLAGGETGPMYPIEIGPDLGLLTPAIDAVSPVELAPGSEILIEGRNFGLQPDSHTSLVQLSLAFAGQEIRVDASEWRDTYIVARVHSDVSGVGALRGGILRVRNRLALEAVEGGLAFSPVEEVVDLERGPFHAMCHPRNFPPLCLVGESRSLAAYDLQLRNGWTVRESWIDIIEDHSMGANYGAHFERQPEAGSATLRTAVVVWADAYSMVECRAHVVISGPRGTSSR